MHITLYLQNSTANLQKYSERVICFIAVILKKNMLTQAKDIKHAFQSRLDKWNYGCYE